MKNNSLPELLAPAGSPEALAAALKNGADAVYFGANSFNCRMRAHNFSSEAIKRAIDDCKKSGAKSYITLNTKIKDIELDDALALAKDLSEAGADAFIVSDPGLSRLIHKKYPDIELHGSTQFTANSSFDAVALQDLGFSRLVSAREMSRDQIKKLTAASPIDIEIFVHGAHCASLSGQCLASFAMGGRSGNRGDCAQPCRLPYTLAKNKAPAPLLSMRDMCLAGHIPEIIDTGVGSLKLEGRLKNSSYVGTVVKIYRKLLDEGRAATKTEISELRSAFPERGFTDFYFTHNDRIGGFGTSYLFGVTPHTRESEFARELPAEILKSASFLKREQVTKSALGYFDVIYLPINEAMRGDCVTLPPYLLDDDYPALLQRLKELSPPAIEFHTAGQLVAMKSAGINARFTASMRLNVFNSASAKYLKELGADGFTYSPELPLAAMRDIRLRGEAVVYGRLPLMYISPDTLGIAQSGCLTDRRGERFPLISEGDYFSAVYNSVPIWSADIPDKLKKAKLASERYIFTTETKDEINAVIASYKKRLAPTGKFRRL